jgi:hypothetical protein
MRHSMALDACERLRGELRETQRLLREAQWYRGAAEREAGRLRERAASVPVAEVAT